MIQEHAEARDILIAQD